MAVKKQYAAHTKGYKCPMCDEVCESKAKAKVHCIDGIEVVYSCGNCFEEFGSAKLASKCCVECYTCLECYEDFGTEQEAKDCGCMYRIQRQWRQLKGI